MVNEDKAVRYQRLRSRAVGLGWTMAALFVVLMFITGGAVALRSRVVERTGDVTVLSVALYVAIFSLLLDLVALPSAFYQGVTLERRYRVSTQSNAHWWRDRFQSSAAGLLLRVLEAIVLTAILRWASRYWWPLSAVVFSALLVGLARVAPVRLMPLFYRFRPLDRPALAGRLLALAERARAGVVDVFEWQLSDRTGKAQAVLVGLGGSRRILLSDTLLAEYSDDEIEVILAHELAHHVNGDVRVGLIVTSLRIAAGFFVAHVFMTLWAPAFGLSGLADLAALPLIGAGVEVGMRALSPLAHALSRIHERRADRYALEMTRNPAAFVSAMKRLSAQNLIVETPSRFSTFYRSHPSTSARIAAARDWAADHTR
jgi:STE24 endopeptidase